MNPVVFLLLAVIIVAVGSVVLYLRSRTPSSVDDGIDNFQREMQALAPRDGDGSPRGGRGS